MQNVVPTLNIEQYRSLVTNIKHSMSFAHCRYVILDHIILCKEIKIYQFLQCTQVECKAVQKFIALFMKKKNIIIYITLQTTRCMLLCSVSIE